MHKMTVEQRLYYKLKEHGLACKWPFWMRWYIEVFELIGTNNVVEAAKQSWDNSDPERAFVENLQHIAEEIDPLRVGVGNPIRNRKLVRREWVKLNPPKNGFYICGLCNKPVSLAKMTIDHILEKSTYPELKYELSNFQPSHKSCNQIKGAAHALMMKAQNAS